MSDNSIDTSHSEGRDSDNVSSRVDKVMQEQQLLAVTQAEAETEQQKKRQRAELADHRTRLLKAVQVEAPDLAAPLFEKLSALAHDNHEFAPREVVDLLKSHKARFKDEPDFFDLGIAQRADLLDRVGFYRGVVIDHSLSNPVEVGFRDVLMRPDDAPAESQRLLPARLFYRKPNFSGYFENYYTTSETMFQTQKNGVTNLTFSLGIAAGGLSNSGSLGLSFSSYGRQEESGGFTGKMVFTTANFFLPKIELSFDDTTACASHAFLSACEHAVADPEKKRTWQTKFRDLKKVLDAFGHFIPLQTLVGGRLFATEKKLFEGSEKASDFTDRFGGKVKASLSTVYADAEASAGYENSKQEAAKQKNSSETQTMTFNAIGGEGTVVQDAAAWSESLYDYRRWANVQRENLIPTLQVLPKDVSDLCWEVLKEYGRTRTKQDLLHEDKAYFLFYGMYGDEVGSKAREVYFSILNNAYDAAVAVKTVTPSEGEDAILTKPETVDSQLWRMTENGQLVLRATDRKTLHGNSSEIYFALTADLPAAPDKPLKDEYPVILCQLNKDSAQIWDYPGSGELTCRALGKDYILNAQTADSLTLKKRALASRLSHLWYLAECPPEAEELLKATVPENGDEQWIQIASDFNGDVLSVSLAESYADENSKHADEYEVVVQPDIGGEHQFWRRDKFGRYVSALGFRQGGGNRELILSADDKSRRILAAPYVPELAQKWDHGVDGKLSPRTGGLIGEFLACCAWDKTDKNARGSALIFGNGSNRRPQSWLIKDATSRYIRKNSYSLSSRRDENEVCNIHYIDETELMVEGRLGGLEFFINRKPGWADEYVLRMKASSYSSEEKLHETRPPEEVNTDSLTPLYKDQRQVYVSPALLYLPETGIFSVRLDCSNITDSVRMLRLMYRLQKDGPWHIFRENAAPQGNGFLRSNELDIALYQTLSGADKKIIAIGIDFDPQGQKITPKILQV